MNCPDYFHIHKYIFIPLLIIYLFIGGIQRTASAQTEYDLIFVQIPDSDFSEITNGMFADRYIKGSRIVLLSANTTKTINLTPEFYAACDPDISFDAKNILFAGKKNTGDYWQIWSLALDGTEKIQITDLEGECVAPVYAGNRFYLDDPEPTPQIIFSSSAHGWKDRKTGKSIFSLYGTDLMGKAIHRLTFNLNNDLEPDILPNGRIVFASWQSSLHNDLPDEKFAFMAINNDGTDLMPYYGNHEPPVYKNNIHISNTDRRIYIIEADSNYNLGGGALASLSQKRPLHSYHSMSFADKGLFHSPCALPDGGLLASYKSKNSRDLYAIYKIDPVSGQQMDRIFAEPGWHSIDMHIVQERPKVKGRSNWLIPGATDGIFYCLDAYRTSLDQKNGINRGDIKFVRVIEGIPYKPDALNLQDRDKVQLEDSEEFIARRILGMAPVEKDGSFQIRIPAEIPVNFQLLDKDYMTIRRQEAWIWVIGNENRGCIGCHENRELAPPNILVDAVTKPPVSLVIPADQRRTPDFRHNVGQLVQENCANKNCHVSQKNILNLKEEYHSAKKNSVFDVYQKLVKSPTKKFIIPGSALKSPLMRHFIRSKKISDNHTINKTNLTSLPQVPLNEEEWITLVEWIDLGARWDWKSVLYKQTYGQ